MAYRRPEEKSIVKIRNRIAQRYLVVFDVADLAVVETNVAIRRKNRLRENIFKRRRFEILEEIELKRMLFCQRIFYVGAQQTIEDRCFFIVGVGFIIPKRRH